MSRNFELMQQAVPSDKIDSGRPMRAVFEAEPNERSHPSRVDFDVEWTAREELLKLVQRVFLVEGPKRCRAVIFAGVDPGDGSARLCADAAKILAQNAGNQVCLVDANPHSSCLAQLVGATNRSGGADVLLQGGAIGGFTQRLNPENLRFLSFQSLGADTASLLSGDGLKTQLIELLDKFEYLLFNAPSVILDRTTTVLGPLVDGVVLVVEANSTHRAVARKAKERLESANVQLLGAVFNNRTFPIPASVYSRL